MSAETVTDEDGVWLVTRCRDGTVTGCVLIQPSPAFEAKRPPPPEPVPRGPSLAERVAALEAAIEPVR